MYIFSGSLGSVQLQLRQVLQQLDKQNVAVNLVKLAVKVPKQKIQSKATGVRMDWYDVPHLSAPVRTCPYLSAPVRTCPYLVPFLLSALWLLAEWIRTCSEQARENLSQFTADP